jgi:hypothetical protein
MRLDALFALARWGYPRRFQGLSRPPPFQVVLAPTSGATIRGSLARAYSSATQSDSRVSRAPCLASLREGKVLRCLHN